MSSTRRARRSSQSPRLESWEDDKIDSGEGSDSPVQTSSRRSGRAGARGADSGKKGGGFSVPGAATAAAKTRWSRSEGDASAAGNADSPRRFQRDSRSGKKRTLDSEDDANTSDDGEGDQGADDRSEADAEDAGYTETQFQPPEEDEDSQLWSVQGILGEDQLRKRYLLRWEGIDPEEDYEYEPSWEPKSSCTDTLIQEWKARVAADPSIRKKKYADDKLKEWFEARRLERRKRANRETKKRQEQARAGTGSSNGKSSNANGSSDRAPAEKEVDGSKRKRQGDDEDEDKVEKKKSKTGAPARTARQVSVASSGAGPTSAVGRRSTTRSAASPSDALPKRTRTTRSRSHTANLTPSKNTTAATAQGGPSGNTKPLRARLSVELPQGPVHRASERGKKTQQVGFADELDIGETDDAALDILEASDDEEEQQPASDIAKVEGKGKGKERRQEASQGEADTTMEEETFLDPRSKEDESYRPTRPKKSASATNAAASATAGPSGSKQTTPKKKVKSKELGPVPQPSLSAFKQPTPTRGTVASTQDPIMQYSSPTASAQQAQADKVKGMGRKGKGKDAARKSPQVEETGLLRKVVDGEVVLYRLEDAANFESDDQDEGPDMNGEGLGDVAMDENGAQDEDDTAGSQAPKQALRTRIVDGEEVLVRADEPSEDEAEGEAEVEGVAVVEEQVEVQVLVEETMPNAAAAVQEQVETGGQAGDENTQVVQTAIEKSVQVETITVTDPAATTEDRSVQVDVVPEKEKDKAVMVDAATDAMTPVPSRINPASAAGSSAAAPDAAQTAELAELRATVARLQGRNATLTEETTFLREQYQNASTMATGHAGEAMRLQDELDRKTKQLRTAVKQRDAHWKGIMAQRASRERYLEGQLKICTDQSRRTDDAIRRKAATFDRMERENEALRLDHGILSQRVEVLSERNEALMDQLAHLRAMGMGVLDAEDSEGGHGHGEDDSAEGSATDSGSEFGSESDAQSTDDGRAPPHAYADAKERMRAKGYAVQQSSSFASIGPSPGPGLGSGEGGGSVIPDPSGSTTNGSAATAEQGVSEGFETSADGTGFVCRYTTDGVACDQVADSRAALQDHLLRHTAGIQPLP